MRAILTVIGKDKVGIVYRVSEKLAEFNINILDINQTTMQEYFTMVMLVDCTDKTKDFTEIQEAFDALGNDMHLNIRLQNEALYNAMYTL